MKTLKQKFDSIDQSKISDTQKAFLDKVKDVTENFKSKDKEVNDKVETALDKMIETFKEKMPEALKGNSTGQPKKRNAMSVAKEIRKEGESFTEAKKRASKKIADDKESAKQTIKSELDKLNTFIKSRKKLANIKGTDLLIDSKRKALPKGKRISKNTGKVYYEYRDSKTDRLSPNYPKNAPYLAGGGGVDGIEVIKLKVYSTSGNIIREGDFLINYNDSTITFPSGKTFKVVEDREYTFKIQKTQIKANRGIRGLAEFLKDINKPDTPFKSFAMTLIDLDKDGKYELGGSVVTDLAGHTGGSLGVGNKGMLDGFSNTSYSGLVGETGAMSSGEMFMNGGGIPNNYKGKTPEEVWNLWTEKQKQHFLLDHYSHFKLEDLIGKNLIDISRLKYNKLPSGIRLEVDLHVNRGQYADGGSVGMANQQVIDDASQSYVNYYLGEGASAGMFKNGGAIKNQYAGRTPEDVWNNWTQKQKLHFLKDHRVFVSLAEDKRASLYRYDELPKYLLIEIKEKLTEHISEGQYARGGGVGYSKKERVIDYYYNNDVFDDYETYELSEKDLDNEDKVVKAIIKYHDLDDPKMVKERFYNLGLDEYAKGGGVRKVGNREYSYGRNWTNDHRHINQSENHEVKYTRKGKFLGIFNSGGALKNERKHVNHSEDYEIRYAKPRPSRKGYKGARKFMAGGVNNETPKIYVANLEAYNNGKLVGIWLDMDDYDDAKELMREINNFIKNSGGDEYAIHDTENIPSSLYSEYMGENDFQEIYNMMELAEENHLPLEVVMMVINEYGESAVQEFMGKYDNEEDFAEQLVDDLGIENFIDFQSYLDISETDRRLLAQDMADSYADDIRDEDEGRRLIEEGGLDLDEFENADDDRKEEMLDEARESVYDEYYDNWYQGLSDPYYFLVEEQGLYSPEDFAKADFVIVDYEKLGDALGYDYGFIYKDGDLYVFNVR